MDRYKSIGFANIFNDGSGLIYQSLDIAQGVNYASNVAAGGVEVFVKVVKPPRPSVILSEGNASVTWTARDGYTLNNATNKDIRSFRNVGKLALYWLCDDDDLSLLLNLRDATIEWEETNTREEIS